MSCNHNIKDYPEPKCGDWSCFPKLKKIFIDPATMEVFDEEENYLGKATKQPDGTYTVEHEQAKEHY